MTIKKITPSESFSKISSDVELTLVKLSGRNVKILVLTKDNFKSTTPVGNLKKSPEQETYGLEFPYQYLLEDIEGTVRN